MVTDNVSREDTEIVLSAFRKHVQLDNVGVYFRKGYDPNLLPAFIEFLGEPDTWLYLSAAAAYFLGKIKHRFTDRILEEAEKYFFSAKDDPIVDHAKAIAGLHSKTGKRVSVHVKTCGESHRPAAVLVIATEDPLTAALCLSRFVEA
jgi:hypothetical protein